MRPSTLCCALGLIGASCGSDKAAPIDAAAPSDATSDAALTPDAARDTDCAAILRTDITFDLDPDGYPRQLNPRAVSDGQTIWITYSRVADATFDNEDVVWAALRCDGSRVFAPATVNTTTAPTSWYPEIAIGDDGSLAIAWDLLDDGATPARRDILYRLFEADGTPSMATDRVLETTRNGEPVPSHEQPAIAPQPGGSYAIAGSREVAAAGGFQAFIQRIDTAGEPSGEAIEGAFEPDVYHHWSTMDATADGTLYVAWTRTDPATMEWVVHGRIPPGGTAVEPSPPAFVPGGGFPSRVRCAAAEPAAAYLAVQRLSDGEWDLLLLDAASAPTGTPPVVLGTAGLVDDNPNIATGGPDRGVVVWTERPSSPRSTVVLRRFSFDGDTFMLGDPVRISTDGMAVAEIPAVAHVFDEIYFVAWSGFIEGAPDYENVVRGRFVDVSP